MKFKSNFKYKFYYFLEFVLIFIGFIVILLLDSQYHDSIKASFLGFEYQEFTYVSLFFIFVEAIIAMCFVKSVRKWLYVLSVCLEIKDNVVIYSYGVIIEKIKCLERKNILEVKYSQDGIESLIKSGDLTIFGTNGTLFKVKCISGIDQIKLLLESNEKINHVKKMKK